MRTAHREIARPRVDVQLDVVAVVAVGGALGSLARWAVDEALPTGQGELPWSTLVQNVTGAYLIGLVMVLSLDVLPPTRYLRPFLAVGVLGGFTTFSAYALDTRTLLADGHGPLAVTYLVGTLVAGLAAVWGGAVSGRAATHLVRRRR